MLDEHCPCGCGRPRTGRAAGAPPDVRSRRDDQEVVGEEVEQGVGRLAGAAAVDGGASSSRCRCRSRPPASSRGRTGCACAAVGPRAACPPLEGGQPLLELGLDAADGARACAPRPRRSGWPGRPPARRASSTLLAGERVDDGDALDLVAEQLDAHRRLVVGGVDLDGVAPDPELAPDEVHVVALVLHVDQRAQDRRAGRGSRRRRTHQELIAVLLGRARGRRCTTPTPPRWCRAG